jgi:hypothetical protein
MTSEKKKETMRKYYSEHKGKMIEDMNKWRRKNSKKYYKRKAQHVKERYATDGEFRRKSKARHKAQYWFPVVECIRCGSKEMLQRHHKDYNKPLEVVILCQRCHREEHNGN